jgi:hypothetical protein
MKFIKEFAGLDWSDEDEDDIGVIVVVIVVDIVDDDDDDDDDDVVVDGELLSALAKKLNFACKLDKLLG